MDDFMWSRVSDRNEQKVRSEHEGSHAEEIQHYVHGCKPWLHALVGCEIWQHLSRIPAKVREPLPRSPDVRRWLAAAAHQHDGISLPERG
jgi:hypothetical protein